MSRSNRLHYILLMFSVMMFRYLSRSLLSTNVIEVEH